tara:strand:+ start:364 stop:1605 length:1242 start_codon:yes stop_codon:yes gene_type:complete
MMLAMDAAWVVLKEDLLEWPYKDEQMGGGAHRGVFPHPTNPEQVVKIPHGSGINYGDMMHTAHNQALAAAGEPVLPESPVVLNQPVEVSDTGRVIDTAPAAGFAQTRLQYPTIGTSASKFGHEQRRRLKNIGSDFAYNPDEATLTSVLSRDLHNDNLSFNTPPQQLMGLSDEELRNRILAIDGMSRFSGAHDKMDDESPEDSTGLLGRLLFAHDQDPEKFNAYMAKLGDRAQFDPWMDALVHRPNTDADRGIPTAPEKVAERQSANQRRAADIAYNEYVNALNATRRLAGFVQDPYQTTLNEHNKFPEFTAQPTSPYHDTILREAIIRARQLQAERAAQGLAPIPESRFYTKGAEALDTQLHDMITRKIRPQLEDEIVEGFGAAKRNDMGAEVPMVRRLLGPETERQLLRRRE